jgi:hypothetical protein
LQFLRKHGVVERAIRGHHERLRPDVGRASRTKSSGNPIGMQCMLTRCDVAGGTFGNLREGTVLAATGRK